MILDSINSIYLKNLMQSTMADGLVVLHYQLWILCIKRTIVCKQYTLVPVIGISQVGIILSYTTYLKIGQILLLNEISPRGSCLSNTGKKILRFSLKDLYRAVRFDKQILSISIHFTKRDIRKIQIDGNPIISRNTMLRSKLHQNNLKSVNKERTL